MDFDVADIRTAREAQVISGMFYDRRVFLVVNTGEARPVVIAFIPHQADAIGRDLVERVSNGEVRGQRLEPRAVPAPFPPRHRSSKGPDTAPAT